MLMIRMDICRKDLSLRMKQSHKMSNVSSLRSVEQSLSVMLVDGIGSVLIAAAIQNRSSLTTNFLLIK